MMYDMRECEPEKYKHAVSQMGGCRIAKTYEDGQQVRKGAALCNCSC